MRRSDSSETTECSIGPMPESARRLIGRITLAAKLPGKRRTGNPSAPFEVAGVGDGLTANLHGHEAGYGGYSQGEPMEYRANPRPDRWRPRPHAQRTGSTPRVRPSGAALQLDPSHRSSPERFSDNTLPMLDPVYG